MYISYCRTFCIAIILVALPLAGCQTINNEKIGTLIGTGGGALIGSKFGKGKGKVFSTIAGGVLGGYIGNKIGSYLDKQDRESLAVSTQKTFETGKMQSWNNPKTGVSATTKIVETPASKKREETKVATTAYKKCNTVEQKIVLENGSTKVENVTACKGVNGWEVI